MKSWTKSYNAVKDNECTYVYTQHSNVKDLKKLIKASDTDDWPALPNIDLLGHVVIEAMPKVKFIPALF